MPCRHTPLLVHFWRDGLHPSKDWETTTNDNNDNSNNNDNNNHNKHNDTRSNTYNNNNNNTNNKTFAPGRDDKW